MDEEGGVVIEPTQEFVIKAWDKYKEKVFVNVCSHPLIDEPEEKHIVQQGASVRIPMSMGRLKEDHDKKGDICKVVDVVMNPNTVAKVKNDVSMYEFL